MARHSVCLLVVLAITSLVSASSTITLLDQNFDSFDPASPPAGWSVKNNSVLLDVTSLLVFDANGNGPDGKVAYPTPWTPPWTSKSAGYTNGNEGDYVANSPQLIEKTFTVAPDTYALEIDLDRYVYWSRTESDEQHWQVANIFTLLTDDDYDIPLGEWMGDQNGGGWDDDLHSPIGSFRSTRWADDSIDYVAPFGEYNGVWEHKTVRKSITTARGSFAFRLLLLRKDTGAQSALWDNIHLKLKKGDTVVASIDEDFQSANPLAAWTAHSPGLLYNNDTPMQFSSTDVKLYTNTSNPGSPSVGFSSDLPMNDSTSAEWLQWQLPDAVEPGTYNIRVQFDRYVYKASLGDPNALGNRVYLLTDLEYDNPAYDFDTVPTAGFRHDYWPGDNAWALNGVWNHEVIDTTMTTTSGNLELRLLQHDKDPGAQAVAWDNVKITVTSPCNDPWADANGDTFVDMLDFAELQRCLTAGAPTVPPSQECTCFDRPPTGGGPRDDAVTSADMEAFIICATGPQVPWVSPDASCTTP